jgi:hypothetical protein
MNEKRMKRTKRQRRDARGSALLVSLMVIVGLSLLGLGFVTISETESAIARNQQSSLQTQAVAEAGARMVVEWFQDPDWGLASGGMPSNDPTVNNKITNIKVNRVINKDTSGTLEKGYYKPKATAKLFDKPYRPGLEDRFFGDENTADIIINRSTDATTIDKVNNALLGSSVLDKTQGEVTEIRVFAPPVVGGTLTADGTTTNSDGSPRQFWLGSQRYGVATIKVTAQQFRDPSLTDTSTPKKTDPSNVLSTHSVRVVIGEMPLPIPSGPIQGNANVSFGGNFTVHWGMETAKGTLNPSRDISSLPWANAYERPHFEHGYEPVSAEIWPTVAATSYDDLDYFHELLGKNFGDPWYGARSMGDNTADGTTATGVNPQCYPYAQTANEVSTGNPSYSFQWQDINSYPLRKKVIFPTINYDFWKKIASQGKGYKGLYYFKWDAGSSKFLKNGTGTGKAMADWVNTVNGAKLGAGVYFFDTVHGKNPQSMTGAAKAAELTPGESWNSSDMGGGMLMSGFVYMNADSFGTTGAGNSQTTIDANFPGEPFRDIGYPQWDTGTGAWKDCGGTPCRSGVGDGTFSYQDLNGNGRFDVVTMVSPAYQSHDPGAVNGPATYVVKTWKSTVKAQADYGAPCTAPPATGAPSGTNCSEPHEPYLNFIYPTTASASVTVGWQAYGTQTYRPKKKVAGAAVACPDATNPDNCTSNSYDLDGAMVDLDVILYGIIYNEGEYDAAGNAAYYGSVLIQEDVVKGNGTADVWFDEKLIKGSWAPPNMPRVMVFSEQMDEQQ